MHELLFFYSMHQPHFQRWCMYPLFFISCITYLRFPQAFHPNLPNGREEKWCRNLFSERSCITFPPLPGKRPELEVRRTRSRACTQVHERIESGRTASGPRSDEKRCTKGRGPSCISSSHHNSKGERIDDECFLCPFSSSILILSEITDYFFFR